MESTNTINFSDFISNGIIFVELHWSNVNDKIKSYIKTICCSNNISFCDACVYCKKVNDNAYYDYLSFNCYQTSVKKDEILEIKNIFAYTSLESIKNKFCVIYGIEKLSKFAYNSILKILEDSPPDTYFIFTTRNLHAVPATIRSRCKIIRLLPEKDKLQSLLKNQLINQNDLDSISNIYYSYDEALEAIENGEYKLIKEVSENIFLSINDFVLQRDTLSIFKKMDYFKIRKIFSYLLPKVNLKLKTEYLELMSNLYFNLNKTLIFHKLIYFLKS
ncbi:MAG: hypothetical protein RR201_00785 [Malacoplasma sp.]